MRVLDSEEEGIEGVIVDINLFEVGIQDASGHTIHYPNNLFFQKPVMIELPPPTEAPSSAPTADAPMEI